MKHTIRMLIGCLMPLLLIFVLPLLGIGSGKTLFVFIVLMFGCHLMMMGGHGKHGEARHDGETGHGTH